MIAQHMQIYCDITQPVNRCVHMQAGNQVTARNQVKTGNQTLHLQYMHRNNLYNPY